MKNIEKRVQDLEVDTIPVMEDSIKTMQTDIKSLQESNKKLSAAAQRNEGNTQESITAAVLEEMRERESRKNNLIIHNLEEPGAEFVDSKERMEKDIEKVQCLIDQIEVQINISDVCRFAKRLGPREESSGTPRPLLIGFKTVDHCNSILEKSPDLAKMDEPLSNINIIRDLTKTQRKEEKNLRVEADKKNAELSEEDQGNWKWVVVGRRGERKIVKIEVVREEEEGGSTSARGRGRGRGRGKGRPPKNTRK